MIKCEQDRPLLMVCVQWFMMLRRMHPHPSVGNEKCFSKEVEYITW